MISLRMTPEIEARVPQTQRSAARAHFLQTLYGWWTFSGCHVYTHNRVPRVAVQPTVSAARAQRGSWQLSGKRRSSGVAQTHWPPTPMFKTPAAETTWHCNVWIVRERVCVRACAEPNPPSLSVLASPGIPRNNRAVAAFGAPPTRSAAWRERPPSRVASCRGTGGPRTKGRSV